MEKEASQSGGITKKLSATRLRTYNDCSWKYYCQYGTIRVPQAENEGSLRGQCVHLVLGVLLNPRRKKHVESIKTKKTIEAVESVKRLLIKHLNKRNINTTDNFILLDELLITALNSDFYIKGAELQEPEMHFEIANENHIINGFLDKVGIFHDKKLIKIVDYKSSKKSFTTKDLESDFQAMMYSMAAKMRWPGYDVIVEFQFLRFKNPVRVAPQFSLYELDGFSQYLDYVSEQINNFTEEDALANLAYYNPQTSWLCGRGSFVCPYKNAFEYYAIQDSEGNITKTDLSWEKLSKRLKEGQEIITMKYEGCPAWNFNKSEDPFEGL